MLGLFEAPRTTAVNFTVMGWEALRKHSGIAGPCYLTLPPLLPSIGAMNSASWEAPRKAYGKQWRKISLHSEEGEGPCLQDSEVCKDIRWAQRAFQGSQGTLSFLLPSPPHSAAHPEQNMKPPPLVQKAAGPRARPCLEGGSGLYHTYGVQVPPVGLVLCGSQTDSLPGPMQEKGEQWPSLSP